MTTAAFDSLGYAKILEQGGFTREQAEAQIKILQKALESQDEANSRALATKGDVQELRLEIEKVKYAMLKWQLGIGLALAALLAKGFHWFGF